MAKRILEVQGRLTSLDQGLNQGPDLTNAIKTNQSSREISWTSPVTAQTDGFQLTWESWFYTEGITQTLYRARNSGSGIEHNLTTNSNGSWTFQIARANFSDHYFIGTGTRITPDNQWTQYLVSSDLTSAATPILETVMNGILVPASSRSLNIINGSTLHSFNDPPAATHDVFLSVFSHTAARIWLDNTSFLDLTQQANIDKFIDANFRPIQLGPDGANPTGNTPLFFMQNDVASILQNLGRARNADVLDGTWLDAGHNPTSPARFAHGTGTSPNNAGLQLPGATLGLTDTQQFSVSMWFKTPLTTTSGTLVYASDSSGSKRLVIEYGPTGLIDLTAADSSGTTILSAAATLDDVADNLWHHIAISINMQAAVSSDSVRIFIDDVDAVPSVSTFVQGGNINLGQTGLAFAILNETSLLSLTQGEFSQFWCFPGVFVDFAVAATRAKYVGFTSKAIPIDLGDNGETPLGASPIIFTGEGPTFVESTPLLNLNRGSAGGTFTVSRGPWVSPTDNPARTQLGI